jgi:hypothetical protein
VNVKSYVVIATLPEGVNSFADASLTQIVESLQPVYKYFGRRLPENKAEPRRAQMLKKQLLDVLFNFFKMEMKFPFFG